MNVIFPSMAEISAARGDLRALCETDYLDNLIENEIDFPELSEGR